MDLPKLSILTAKTASIDLATMYFCSYSTVHVRLESCVVALLLVVPPRL